MLTPRTLSRITFSLAAFGMAACAEPAMSPELDLTPALKAGGKPGGGSTTWDGGPVTSTLATGTVGYAGVNGSYANSTGVVSTVQSVGDWVLETNGKRSTRYVDVTLDGTTAVLLGTNSLPFTGTQRIQGRFISKISITDPALGPTRYQDMTSGQTKDVPLVFAFSYGGQSYRITMNPGQDPDVNPSPNLTSTNMARATCNAADSNGKCSAWSLVPTGEGGNTGLLMIVGNTGTTDVALVTMNFAIDFGR